MSNPILQSELFERAAYTLVRAMENGIKTDGFEEAVERFGRHVESLVAAIDRLTERLERKEGGDGR